MYLRTVALSVLLALVACDTSSDDQNEGDTIDAVEQSIACQVTRSFRAHAAGNLSAKYSVPPNSERRVCFTFANPLSANELVYGEAPIFDDRRVVACWMLFASTEGTHGAINEPCSGTVVAGAGPGTQDYVFPSDVGMRITEPFVKLEVHYINRNADAGLDASGVSFCTTTQSRPNIAGRVRLGTPFISIPQNATNFSVVGTCSNLPVSTQSVYAIDARPEMWHLGIAFRAQHVRGGLSLPDWINSPFMSDQQSHHSLNRIEIRPGDVLRTTCTYRNLTSRSVGFGTNSDDELCWDWVTVYPISAARRTCP